VERNILSNSPDRRSLSLAQHGDALPAAQLQRNLRRSIVHQHEPRDYHLLHSRPAYRVETRGKKLIKPLAGIFGCNRNENGKRVRHSLRRIADTTRPKDALKYPAF